MRKTVIKTKGLTPYLAVTAGVGCVSSVANAAVTFYGVNSANDTNADPLGISIGMLGFYELGADNYAVAGNSQFSSDGFTTFSRGSNIILNYISMVGFYGSTGPGVPRFINGAVAGDQNYANVSFDGDFVFEAVAQFNFDGMGNGFLVAIATRNEVPDPQDLSAVGGAALSISEGVDLINAASIPEPSSLALLALGSAGLAARRRRKAA